MLVTDKKDFSILPFFRYGKIMYSYFYYGGLKENMEDVILSVGWLVMLRDG